MKETKFTEAKIVFSLKQAEPGVTVPEVCRKMGVSEGTFYNWNRDGGPQEIWWPRSCRITANTAVGEGE